MEGVMLTVAEQYARRRKVERRHHYIMLLKSSDERMTKQVEMFAADIQEAIDLGCRSKIYNEVEIWEDGASRGVRKLH